jgi:hypothetical protein
MTKVLRVDVDRNAVPFGTMFRIPNCKVSGLRCLLIVLTLGVSTAHAGVLDLSSPQAGPFPSAVDLSGGPRDAFAAFEAKEAGPVRRARAMPAASRCGACRVVVRMSEEPQPTFGLLLPD